MFFSFFLIIYLYSMWFETMLTISGYTSEYYCVPLPPVTDCFCFVTKETILISFITENQVDFIDAFESTFRY